MRRRATRRTGVAGRGWRGVLDGNPIAFLSANTIGYYSYNDTQVDNFLAQGHGPVVHFSKYTPYIPFFTTLNHANSLAMLLPTLPTSAIGSRWWIENLLRDSEYHPRYAAGSFRAGRGVWQRMHQLMGTYFLAYWIEDSPIQYLFSLVISRNDYWNFPESWQPHVMVSKHKHKLEFWVSRDYKSAPPAIRKALDDYAMPMMQHQGIRVVMKTSMEFLEAFSPYRQPKFGSIAEMKESKKNIIRTILKQEHV